MPYFRKDFSIPLANTGQSILWEVTYVAEGIEPIKAVAKQILVEVPDFTAKREYEVSKDFDHKNVCKIYEYHEEKKIIVMEFIDGHDLFELFHEIHCEPAKIGGYFKQMLDAVEYLHLQQIAHRDIKMENFMVTNDDIVKLVDFGFTQKCETDSKTTCGSPDYAAPELVNMEITSYDAFKSDIWSLGVCLYAMITLRLPYGHPKDSAQTVLNKIIKEPIEPKLEIIENKSLKILLAGMLNKDPDERFTITQIRDSDWFKTDQCTCNPIIKKLVHNILGGDLLTIGFP